MRPCSENDWVADETDTTLVAARRPITVALAGNPNSGKTTIFNALTGARQHVGNYPGVTVERKEGRLRHAGHTINVVDLPGTYSLTAYSAEELVTRRFLIEERPDVVVDIVDASNLERNLYLAVQFIELGVPLILALNMSDLAEPRGGESRSTRTCSPRCWACPSSQRSDTRAKGSTNSRTPLSRWSRLESSGGRFPSPTIRRSKAN
jgi:small GTP-binding protein